MELIILLLVAGVAGYFLARSRFSKPVDNATDKVTETTKDYADRTEGWFSSRFGRDRKVEPFRAWAAGAGATYLPEDFKSWLAGLSPEEARDFTNSLDKYARGLGYDLNQLVDGSMNAQPAKMQVFTEAVVIYSSAYRKAKQARQEVENPEPQPGAQSKEQAASTDGKTQAEKSVSRRRSDSEPTEIAPTA